jgi:malate dehydrogenase (quinone)
MIELLERCFPDQFRSEAWQQKLQEMVPSLGQPLGKNRELCQAIRESTSSVLGLSKS